MSSEGRIVKRGLYCSGIDMNGKKDVLECMLGKRKCKVLAYHEWIKNRGAGGYPDCMRWMVWEGFARQSRRLIQKQRFSSVSFIRSVIQRSLFPYKDIKTDG